MHPDPYEEEEAMNDQVDVAVTACAIWAILLLCGLAGAIAALVAIIRAVT